MDLGQTGGTYHCLTAVLLSAILIVYAVDEMKIAKHMTAPEDSLPWQQDLPARVYWNELPSYDAQQGFAKTARLLGFKQAHEKERIYGLAQFLET